MSRKNSKQLRQIDKRKGNRRLTKVPKPREKITEDLYFESVEKRYPPAPICPPPDKKHKPTKFARQIAIEETLHASEKSPVELMELKKIYILKRKAQNANQMKDVISPEERESRNYHNFESYPED